MDLLNILINPIHNKTTCCLCFKQDGDTLSVYQKLCICDEYKTTDTTLLAIIKYLFPTHDILFGQACNNCSNILLQIFTILKKHYKLRGMLRKITDTMINLVPSVNNFVSTSNQVYFKLKLPVFSQTKRESTQHECLDSKKPDQLCKVSDSNTFEKPLCCDKCEMKFTSEHFLNEHVKLTHRNKNNAAICEFCGKDCKKPASLKVHLNCHKVKPCPYCGKLLKSHSHYKVHVKNHESNIKKPSRKVQYSCNVCPYKSFNKNSLQAHINKVHLQTRPFICELCNKGFFKKSNLTEHMTVHTKVKNLTCELCGDRFFLKKTLIEHRRLHTGERPFQCEMCNLSFVTAGRKSDHFKRKHMEKTLSCCICNKRFSLKKEVNSHMKKVHGLNRNAEDFQLLGEANIFKNL